MKFNTNVVSVFASKTKMIILKHVMKNGFSATGREVARICNISQTMAIKNLKEFEEMHLVMSRNAGKSVLWSARRDSFAFKVVDSMMREKIKFDPLNHLINLIKKTFFGNGAKEVFLFGSVASGKEKVSSDIDLFILAFNKKDKEQLEQLSEKLSIECTRLYGNPLRAYILDVKEKQLSSNKGLIENIEKGIKII